MCSTEVWRDVFCCLWVVLLVWWFHQLGPILSVPHPRSSACPPRTPRLPKPGTPELCPACRVGRIAITNRVKSKSPGFGQGFCFSTHSNSTNSF